MRKRQADRNEPFSFERGPSKSFTEGAAVCAQGANAVIASCANPLDLLRPEWLVFAPDLPAEFPTGHPSVHTEPAGGGAVGADLGEPFVFRREGRRVARPERKGGVLINHVAPADRGAILPQPAGVDPSSRDCRETFVCWRAQLAAGVAPPTDDAPVRPQPAGVFLPRADLGELDRLAVATRCQSPSGQHHSCGHRRRRQRTSHQSTPWYRA